MQIMRNVAMAQGIIYSQNVNEPYNKINLKKNKYISYHNKNLDLYTFLSTLIAQDTSKVDKFKVLLDFYSILHRRILFTV